VLSRDWHRSLCLGCGIALLAVAPAGAFAAPVPDGGVRLDGPPDAADAGTTPIAPDANDAAVDGTLARLDAPGEAGSLLPVRGTVVEKGTVRPVSHLKIIIDDVEVETDEHGAFDVLAAAGPHRLRIRAPGYEDLDTTIAVTPPLGFLGTLRIYPRSDVPIGETTVRTVKLREPAIAISGEEARKSPGASGDPFRVLSSLPGVSQVLWPLALYTIRGANPGNTGFFVDDIRIPALFHLALGPSIIHPALISGLEFYPGGYPARYDGYVSGIVTATTEGPPLHRRMYSVDVRLYDAGALVVHPWNDGKGTIAAAARYSYTGLVISRLSPDVDYAYADYQLRAQHPLAGGQATLFFLGSYDQLNIKLQQVGDASLTFHRGQLRWIRALGPGRLLASGTLGADAAASTLYDDPITVRTVSALPRLQYLVHLAPWLDVEIGTTGEWKRFRTAISGDTAQTLGQSDLARPRTLQVLGAYLSLDWAPFSRLSIVAASRFDEYFEQGVSRGAIQPRLTARLRLTPAASLKASVGQFAQMPSLPLGVAGFEGFGLRDFGLQRSIQGSAGTDVSLGDGAVSVGLTGFYQALRVSDVASIFDRVVTAENFLEMRQGRAYGVELMIRSDRRRRLHGWLAYTLSWSERAVDGAWGPSDWDQRHILNLLASYHLKRRTSVGVRFHYNSGRPFPIPTATGGAEYQRLPAFYQLDLRADKRWLFDRWLLDVYIEFGNATLTRNVTNLTVSNPNTLMGPMGNQRTINEVGFRLLLPSIGIHAEF